MREGRGAWVGVGPSGCPHEHAEGCQLSLSLGSRTQSLISGGLDPLGALTLGPAA